MATRKSGLRDRMNDFHFVITKLDGTKMVVSSSDDDDAATESTDSDEDAEG